MAKLTLEKTGESLELVDGENIMETAEQLGVPFACRKGECQTCAIDIIEGEDNLSDLTDNEKKQNKDSKHRLACQSKIKQGEVKITF